MNSEIIQSDTGELAGSAVGGLQRSSSMTSTPSSRSSRLAFSRTGNTTPDDVSVESATTVGASLAELRQQQIARDLAARRQQLTKRGSILSNYIGGLPLAGFRHDLDDNLDSDLELENDEDDDFEYDECDDDVISHVSRSSMATSDRDSEIEHQVTATPLQKSTGRRSRGSTIDSSDPHHHHHQQQQQPHHIQSQHSLSRGSSSTSHSRGGGTVRTINAGSHSSSRLVTTSSGGGGVLTRSLTRQQPIGAYSNDTDMVSDHREVDKNEVADVDSCAAERLFKIVFIGDSSVGKSTFIYQFCKQEFNANFQATIGVDFQVKNIRVEGHVIALQLWDTAGQERFRSITKQYFRKSDGVLVMYDVTSEKSFSNLRNWMSSVQEGTEEGTVILMVGNKLDLLDSNVSRAVKINDGVRLAEEFGALFFETSAKSGVGIQDAMNAMARLLLKREDIEMEKAIQLLSVINADKKRTCCVSNKRS